MPDFEITPEDIKDYVQCRKVHSAYKDAVAIEDHLRFHIDGYDGKNPTFIKLIDNRRPGETKEIRDYRREIYSNITTRPTSKVINSLKKIMHAKD